MGKKALEVTLETVRQERRRLAGRDTYEYPECTALKKNGHISDPHHLVMAVEAREARQRALDHLDEVAEHYERRLASGDYE